MSELKENPFLEWGDRSEPTVPTITLQLYNYISEEIARPESTYINRASSASMCIRRRFYQKSGVTGTPLTPRKIVNFALGDLTEHMVKYFILKGCVGPGKLYSEVDFGVPGDSFTIQGGKTITIYEQPDLVALLGSIEVTAHADGWGKRNSDGKWELVEVKSAADYGFEEFKENGPGDYLKQAMVNLATNRAAELNADSVRFVYLKKNTGHLWDKHFPFDLKLFRQVVEEYRLASLDTPPERPYLPKIETFRLKPTGRKILAFPCSGYCPYTQKCWPEVKMVWEKNRPVYIVEEKKEVADGVQGSGVEW